jgi:hypothetical protein
MKAHTSVIQNMNLHDEACYHMLRLRHVDGYSTSELERAFDHLCATEWGHDPFEPENNLDDDLRVIGQFCNVHVQRGHTKVW